MKPVKDILRSPQFMREISQLLFVFAALNGLIALLLFMSARGNLEVLVLATASLLQGIVYVVFGFLIRRGSIIALWIFGIFYALESLFILTQPLGSGVAIALFARVALIVMMVRFVLRQRFSD